MTNPSFTTSPLLPVQHHTHTPLSSSYLQTCDVLLLLGPCCQLPGHQPNPSPAAGGEAAEEATPVQLLLPCCLCWAAQAQKGASFIALFDLFRQKQKVSFCRQRSFSLFLASVKSGAVLARRLGVENISICANVLL